MPQTQDIRGTLLSGRITAISVDTCIFEAGGFKLEQGNLKHLEQFKGGDLSLVFADVTSRELLAHLSKKTDEAFSSLQKGLSDMSSYWQLSEKRRTAIIEEISGDGDHKAKAQQHLSAFYKRCNATLLRASEYADMEELIDRYFTALPPFDVGKKKHEFPDALALMTLESWASKEKKGILFVSKDKGCHDFCAESKNLYAIDDLGTALTLIQERDEHVRSLANKLANEINQAKFPNLLQFITDEVSENIESISWYPEASSYYYHDGEITEIEVNKVQFPNNQNTPPLHPVDFQEDKLVLQTSIIVSITATCDFSFAVKDSIDKDMVGIGNTTATTRSKVIIDALLTVKRPDGDYPEFIAVELVPATRDIDFGEVGPDYSDEDPTFEKY